MSKVFNKLKTSFMPWIIPAISAFLFGLLIIFLNYLFRGKTCFQFLEIDYSLHFFFSRPFKLTKLNDMDSLVVLGSSYLYWGLGWVLFLIFCPDLNKKKQIRKQLSDLVRFLAAGFLIHHFLLLFWCWSLALYEGYIPMIFDDFYLSHGPWHHISHLKILILWSFVSNYLSLILSILSFLLKFNKQSFILTVINFFIFKFNVFELLWLID